MPKIVQQVRFLNETFSREYRGTGPRNYALSENVRKMEENDRKIDERSKLNESTYKSYMPSDVTRRGRLSTQNKVQTDLENILFENVMFAIFKNALILDESFVLEKRDQIKHFLTESLKEKNINLNNIRNKSALLSTISEACKNKSVKEAKEIAEKDAELELEKIKCDDDCEDKDFSDISFNEISEVIKEKVSKVIKDEEEASQEQKDLIEEIASYKSMNESVGITKRTPIDEYTIFKSMMIRNYKDVVQTLQESSSDSIYGSVDNDNIKVDMDLVLCESVLQYTLLEMLYTMKIKDFNVRELKQLSETILYK